MAGNGDLTEDGLIDRYLTAPDAESFAALFKCIYPRILRYFRFRGIPGGRAEELTQDVMMIVYRKSQSIRNQELFRPWLFKVAQNALRQHLRRSRNEPATAPLEDAASQDSMEGNEGFLDAVSGLPEDERQILTLRYLDELSYAEIATVLNLPMGTVKWKIFDSKARLQVRLRQQAPERT